MVLSRYSVPKSDSSEMSSSSQQDIIKNVIEFLQCFICKNKVYETNICPHCSQLFCCSCIKSWILTKGSRCPQCNTQLNIPQLVVCLWADDMIKYLEEFRPEVCSTHSEDMSIYCVTCIGGVCYRCVLWNGTHSGHTIRPLKKLYESKLKHLEDEVASLEKLRDVTDFLAEETVQIEYINNVMKNSAESRLISKSTELEIMISELKKTVSTRIPVPEPANSLSVKPSN
nr:E3 ubiquitin-protein ligase TRIM37-like [Leptinotarsa decemlineata]